MNFIFLIEPPETISYFKDTSFVFMKEAVSRGHSVYYLKEGGISLKTDGAEFQVQKLEVRDMPEKPLFAGEPEILSECDVDAVFIRTDPPFDESYLEMTWVLERLSKRIFIMNAPNGIRSVNEKIWALQFGAFVPETFVTSSASAFRDFLEEKKKVILKPTNQFGGQSIFLLEHTDTNAQVAFETLSHKGDRVVMVQEYIPEASQGDKRILLLNGEPLGAVLRVHAKGDHRNNFFAGGKEEACEITARDEAIIAELKPHLQALGLYFVGIDILGSYLIEVNVTSPTCLQEMNRLYQKSHEKEVIDFVEEQVVKRNGVLK